VPELGYPSFQNCQGVLNVVLGETEYYEEALNGHFNDRFPNESGSKENVEWNSEMATSQPCKIEQRIWNLRQSEKGSLRRHRG